ncbi:MAG: sulfotransferase [Bacteroidota bacterium]
MLLYTLVFIILLSGRILDEILFFRYRFQKVENPVFIISNPRSGTTYLHRLLCLDTNRYTYTLLYHSIFTSVTIIKLIDVIGWVDRRIGRPFRKLFDWIDSKVFDGWKDIHPTGLNQSEEDEGMYVFPLISTAICLICPFMQEFKYLTIPDEMPEWVRKRLKLYFKSSIKRFVYATGKDKTVLSKNVISIGRIKTILEIFPNAKIVYLIRDPRKAVPSFISMFCAPWKLHSPELPKNGPEYRALGQIAIDYYSYFQEIKDELKQKNLFQLEYTDLVAKPVESVRRIYKNFDLPFTEEFLANLEKETQKTRKYRSKHSYSLEAYGFSEKELVKQLAPVMESYGFLKEG